MSKYVKVLSVTGNSLTMIYPQKQLHNLSCMEKRYFCAGCGIVGICSLYIPLHLHDSLRPEVTRHREIKEIINIFIDR